jgi:hypothetical protein
MVASMKAHRTLKLDIYCFIFFMLNSCSVTSDASIKSNIYYLLCLGELDEMLARGCSFTPD